MKSLEQWMNEYGESHQNRINKIIHWMCVPSIFWSVTALLYSVSLGFEINQVPLTLAHLALLLVMLFYMRLSNTLGIAMMIFGLLCLTICNGLVLVGFSLWKIAIIVFVIAWIGQFIGHSIEGKKPSFLKDLQFLLIGPAWLIWQLIRSLGLKV